MDEFIMVGGQYLWVTRTVLILAIVAVFAFIFWLICRD